MKPTITIRLGGRERRIPRARLGRFLDLQAVENRLDEAVKDQDTGGIADALFQYLQVVLPSLDAGEFFEWPWWEVVRAYQEVKLQNTLPDMEQFAILIHRERGGRQPPWHYEGRSKLALLNIFARAYHWTLDQIERLWPEQAIALLQEIVADQVYEREFYYSLSEVAYRYDRATKKYRYQPFRRPSWMTLMVNPGDIITHMPERVLPVGLVEYPEGSDNLRPRRVNGANDDSAGDRDDQDSSAPRK